MRYYLLYVDESGDIGAYNKAAGQTGCSYYALAGIILPMDKWPENLIGMVKLRRELKQIFGFPQSEELHGAELFNPRGKRNYPNPKLQHRSERMKIYHYFLERLSAALPDAKVLTVFLDKVNTTLKQEKWYDTAWRCLLERFQTYMLKQDANAYGMVITDEGNEIHLRKIQRRLRQYNPTSSKFGEWYNNRLDRIIEDPFERQSHHSFLIQAADMIVHALYRQENPKGSYKKFNADRLFLHIKPMTIKEAAADDPLQMGIKRI